MTMRPKRSHIWHCSLAGAIGAALACSPAHAQAGRSITPDASRLKVKVKTVTQDALEATLVALSTQHGAALRTPTGEQLRVPLRDLVRITTIGQGPPALRPLSTLPPQRAFTVWLTNGDVIHGDLIPAKNTEDRDELSRDAASTFVLETVDLGPIVVELDQVSRLASQRASQSAYRVSAGWLDREKERDEDRVLLTNGDVVRGFVMNINRDGVTVDTPFGQTKIARRLLVAMQLASPPPPKATQPAHVVVTFRSSGRLTLEELDWSRGEVRARLIGGASIRVDALRVAKIEVIGGRWEWLSHHRPISFEHTPMLSLAWEYVSDRNVSGGPIRVAGGAYEHGIGVHSRSVLTYDLKGEYSWFTTSIGLDDNSGQYGDVSVAILVDGQPRFEESHLRRGKLIGPVRLDVRNADRIELLTDFGDNGDLQDRFNWVEAALIR